MAEPSILRFPISGLEDGSFLLEVSPNGSRPLDLKLVGSDGAAVFVIKVRHKRIAEYKAATGQCTDQEWEQILKSTLADQQPVHDIEIRSDVEPDGSSATLSFRKNIQGITQRLGSIKLKEDERTEVSPFDWCVSAIAARAKVARDLDTATIKVQSLEDSVNELKSQLDELIKAKDDDETQLLEKFKDLLNEKKVKIRQQQRLLASASVDPQKLANVGASQNTQRHVANASRISKRKALKQESDSSDDGFGKMDVEDDNGGDGGAQLDLSSDDHQATTEDETASEADSDDEPVPPPPKSTAKGKRVAAPTRSTRATTPKESTKTSPSSSQDAGDAPPPPRRNLPFMKGKKAPASAPPPKPTGGDGDGDDETESDDEL